MIAVLKLNKKRGSLGRVFFLLGLLIWVLAGSALRAHPEDEVCDPSEPPTPFCLAMMGQLETEDPPTALDTVREYVGLGVVHIIPRGLDHIAFVLALFLSAQTWRSLVLQVTTFTVAHSITLALTVLGLTTATGPIVEVLIAASIVFVAVENLWLAGNRIRRWRYAVVFGFGLLHGLGFAGVLLELGLPQGQLALALVAFNLGVEGGQLIVVLAAMLLGWGIFLRKFGKQNYHRGFCRPLNLAIAGVGLFWLMQRL
ncbi:MAG: HupE/UreJ family protein [Lysobacterales bacterium]